MQDGVTAPRTPKLPLSGTCEGTCRYRPMQRLSYSRLPGFTETRLRPLARRRDSTARPLLVFIRVRNPCVFERRRRLGWNVRLGMKKTCSSSKSERKESINECRRKRQTGNHHQAQVSPQSSAKTRAANRSDARSLLLLLIKFRAGFRLRSSRSAIGGKLANGAPEAESVQAQPSIESPSSMDR